MTAESKHQGAPPCGLFIRMGDELIGPDLLRRLREIFFVINQGDSLYEKNSHVVCCTSHMADQIDDNKLEALIDIARLQGIVFLLEDRIEKAEKLGADGVLLSELSNIQAARHLMPDDKIVGVRCGLDIDAGEAAIQEGADFVSFHTSNGSLADPKIAAIWSTLSDMPCVMEGPFTNEYVSPYVDAGTNFIEAGSYIWNHHQGVKQATVNMLHAIDLALEDTAQSQNIH